MKKTTAVTTRSKKKTTPAVSVTRKSTVKRTVKPKAAPKKKTTDPQHELALRCAKLTLDKKATNVKLLDLRGITSMTDYFVICSASSEVQVKAIADHVLKTMREKFETAPWKSEGWEARNWIIIDFVDIVVHIFLEAQREFYNLERLWADAPTESVEDKPTVKKTTRKKSTAK